MDDSRSRVNPSSRLRTPVWQTLSWFASLKLAVMLLVGLAAVLAAATFLESAKGSEYAQWHVYKNPWFMALVGMLALNILAAAIVRFPWRWGHFGFLLAHAGVLVLLVGALLTYVAGVEGQLSIEEGQSGERLVMADSNHITTVWAQHEQEFRSPFPPFEPGPTDWPEHTTLPLGAFGGVKLEVLKFYRHARTEEQWDEDPSSVGDPAVQLALIGPDGTSMVQQWFAADPLADDIIWGPVRLTFQCASAASMLEDFVNPPNADKEKKTDGILSMHYEGRMYRIPVRENVGKKVAVGKSDIRVEIVSYLPDGQFDAARFTTASQKPNNPLLELKVYLPGKDKATAAKRICKETTLESRWNSRLELPGQILVSPSGHIAGSRRRLFADARRQAALPGHSGRQDALAWRGEAGQSDSGVRSTPPFHRQVPSARPPEDHLPPG